MKRLLAACALAGAIACGVAIATASPALADVDENGDLIVVQEKEDPTAGIKAVAAYATAAIGFLVVGLAVLKTFNNSMSYPQMRLTLVNFLRSNPYQVLNIGKSMEGTFAEPIAAALKTGGQMYSTDPKIVSAATLPTYDGIGQATVAKFGATMTKAKLGAAAGAAGLAIGLASGRPVPVILGSLALLGFVRLFLYKNRIEGDIVRARAEVLPEVDAAIITQRYYVPPPAPVE
ncbi:MAG TPA: hypothetical protein VGM39_21900 [Kofleriaceae bacterium]|jgi:hypothetical protein